MIWHERPKGARKDVPCGWTIQSEADKEACYRAGFIEGVDYWIKDAYYSDGEP